MSENISSAPVKIFSAAFLMLARCHERQTADIFRYFASDLSLSRLADRGREGLSQGWTKCGKMFVNFEKDIGVLGKGRKNKQAKYGNNEVNNNTEDVNVIAR